VEKMLEARPGDGRVHEKAKNEQLNAALLEKKAGRVPRPDYTGRQNQMR